MGADQQLYAVKPEPRSTVENRDKNGLFISNVKMEDTSLKPTMKMETVFRDLPIKFDPKTDTEINFQFTESTEITVKEEKIINNSERTKYLAHARLSEDPVPLCENEEEKCGSSLYTDIDISYSDVKQECSIFNATVVTDTNAGPPPEYDVKISKKKGSRLRTSKFIGDKLFSCTLCTFTCKQKCDLTRHSISHTGEKPFSCPDCTYKCNRKVHLRDHILTHTGVKLFTCSHCTYWCNRKGQLTSHMFIHSGEKPYACSLCTFTCKQKGVLTRHNKTHSLVKPYSCPECTYTCCQKGDLKIHINRHTGNRRISCSHCTYTCYRKQDLRTHLITHTGVKPFACEFCHYKCCRKKGLVRHMLTHT